MERLGILGKFRDVIDGWIDRLCRKTSRPHLDELSRHVCRSNLLHSCKAQCGMQESALIGRESGKIYPLAAVPASGHYGDS